MAIEDYVNTVSFTGHRPKYFDNYSKTRLDIYWELYFICDKLANKGITKYITGGATGVDTIAFHVINNLKSKYPAIVNAIAVPYRDQANSWNPSDKENYFNILGLSDALIYVDTLSNYRNPDYIEGEHEVNKLHVRNKYMVDNSQMVIAVYNGQPSGTGNCVNYAKKHKNNKMILQLNPDNHYQDTLYYAGEVVDLSLIE